MTEKDPATFITTEAETPLDSLDEIRKAVTALARGGKFGIDIFSPDLEAEIYNNQAFEQAVFDLAKKHPSTAVRILCKDSEKAVKKGHCLIRLAQDLTSTITIHTPAAEHRDEQSAFMLVDSRGVLYRLPAGGKYHHAILGLNSPQRAAGLAGFFNEAWEHSAPDPQIRRLYV